MTFDEYQQINNDINAKYKQNAQLLKDNIEKISKRKDTKTIVYPELKEAFDFVDSVFPKSNVKEVKVLVCDRKFLEDLGYKGIGGFFERVMKTVVIPDNLNFSSNKKTDKKTDIKICAKLTTDEVLVHELFHYVSDTFNKKISSIEMEEEFAYGNSIAYLKKKGYSEEQIINDKFMPFLYNSIDKNKIVKKVLIDKDYDIKEFSTKSTKYQKDIINKYKKQIIEETKKEAFKKGQEIIEIYKPFTTQEIKIEDGSKRFDLIDFGD
jgi:hypothetical protein